MAPTRLERGLRATFLGMVANILLAAAKLVAGIVGHSHALVADAVESLADLFGSVIVWRGLVVAAEPADEDHPYGHGKAEPIAAAVVSTMLLLASAGIIIQSAREIPEPHHTPSAYTLMVLILVIVIKESIFRGHARGSGPADDGAARARNRPRRERQSAERTSRGL